MDKKLKVLEKIAKLLNDNNITFALGASCMLYFKNIVSEFNDIDIMILEEDANKVKELFLKIGDLNDKADNTGYKTKAFMEFVIEEIEIDVIAGFTITKENKDYYLPLNPEKIENISYKNTIIPLDNIEDWLYYYKLMGRENKASLIKDFLNKT